MFIQVGSTYINKNQIVRVVILTNNTVHIIFTTGEQCEYALNVEKVERLKNLLGF